MVRRHGLVIVGEVVPGGCVVEPARILRQPVKSLGRIVRRRLEHQVLEQVRKPRAPLRIILRAHLIPDRDRHRCRVLVGHRIDTQPVAQFLARELQRLNRKPARSFRRISRLIRPARREHARIRTRRRIAHTPTRNQRDQRRSSSQRPANAKHGIPIPCREPINPAWQARFPEASSFIVYRDGEPTGASPAARSRRRPLTHSHLSFRTRASRMMRNPGATPTALVAPGIRVSGAPRLRPERAARWPHPPRCSARSSPSTQASPKP